MIPFYYLTNKKDDYCYKKITPAKKYGVILSVAVISSCFSQSEKTT
ncbi:hypothetical protein XBJ2_1560027 [Xenorhabdus bovienii str. Jollieti]|uniref:Uncharacterized protein n=1 Tax=Xenorhabdus bovienii (strain SS-2004) TaxID=406818 RepID=D3V898_XENBS|nr:hypothetical protein XBJ1_2936 [Xenorhabdus bovienii SS-2004]CDH27884.1 hypothetical protein XBJ2_1560027 [Xenorhabdus bovienii str. Jollieti]